MRSPLQSIDIQEAKRNLAHILLKENDLTDNELTILSLLMKDKDIQEILNKKTRGVK